MAGPRKLIDPDQVTKLAELGYTLAEMAQELKASAATLQRRYADAIEEGRQRRLRELREKQYEAAKKGSVAMLNWLAKQEAAQRQHEKPSQRKGEPLLCELSDDELDEQIQRKLAEAGYPQPSTGTAATGAAPGRKRAAHR
jgi:AraC-like DNA-binding protein